MIGDEENTEFINEITKLENNNESNGGIMQEIKKNHINNLIYFGSILTFTCIIMLLFWNIKKESNQVHQKYGSFTNKNASLLVISQEDFDYFDQLNNTTKVQNCNQNDYNKNTLIVVSNQVMKDDVKECIELFKPKLHDILLIIYNATQESILQDVDDNVNYYYLSSKALSIQNSKIKKFEYLEVDEQKEVIAQIINNIFK
ncbi:unnamed protein product (macronuclear) [Paramecium tetraurelia]|uniref:Peroxisome assembly protein 22 n=1 Tax=Paramecium tetraurelia TaxID=5888 RepID=A0DCG5_PARTE|nr:uncharacterized protein GSPATT00015610001 [Paramecium tetraurelia]CAK80732.1 unnamed protein product [Paramecium tetraurelia]|eukprot:XP_001448129.1 hypothetical protein (macronuclear) [Paramecium tetraurelia strain d4-2]